MLCEQGKHGVGSEGENGNIMLLLDAAQELHRSSSGDEGNDIEPSTAGTGLGDFPPSQLQAHRSSYTATLSEASSLLQTSRLHAGHGASVTGTCSQPARCNAVLEPGCGTGMRAFAELGVTVGAGAGAGRDDARSRKPGLRQAPAKSRKLQEPENGDTLIHPPR